MIYLAYNENLEITNAQMFETENTIPFVEHNFIMPKINLEIMELYEGATAQEIAEFNKPIIPQESPKANVKLAMIDMGISTSIVDDYIAKMPPSLEKDKISVLWYDTDTFQRSNETLNQMASIFNISQEQLDNLFIIANTK